MNLKRFCNFIVFGLILGYFCLAASRPFDRMFFYHDTSTMAPDLPNTLRRIYVSPQREVPHFPPGPGIIVPSNLQVPRLPPGPGIFVPTQHQVSPVPPRAVQPVPPGPVAPVPPGPVPPVPPGPARPLPPGPGIYVPTKSEGIDLPPGPGIFVPPQRRDVTTPPPIIYVPPGPGSFFPSTSGRAFPSPYGSSIPSTSAVAGPSTIDVAGPSTSEVAGPSTSEVAGPSTSEGIPLPGTIQIPEYFTCAKCGKHFGNLAHFGGHLRTCDYRAKHPKKWHICTVCNNSFAAPYYLKRHMKRHTNVGKPTCPMCNRSLFDKYKLRDHMQRCPRGPGYGYRIASRNPLRFIRCNDTTEPSSNVMDRNLRMKILASTKMNRNRLR